MFIVSFDGRVISSACVRELKVQMYKVEDVFGYEIVGDTTIGCISFYRSVESYSPANGDIKHRLEVHKDICHQVLDDFLYSSVVDSFIFEV